MQIMECCYYLNNLNTGKNNDLAKKEDDPNFVRLLTGSRTLCTLTDGDVTVPKDKSMKQMPFNIAVVKKSTGKIQFTRLLIVSLTKTSYLNGNMRRGEEYQSLNIPTPEWNVRSIFSYLDRQKIGFESGISSRTNSPKRSSEQ